MSEVKKYHMDLKYVNEKVLILKIGKLKVPAYSLIGLLIFLLLQNRYAFLLIFLIFFFSTYLETNSENLKTVAYKIAYILKKRIVLPSKKSFLNEKLKNR